MSYTGVILVGGKGSRLKNLTKNQAKPLLPINRKPFLDYLIYYISQYNFDKIFLLCSFKQQNFFKKYHNRKILGVQIICIKEKKPLGTGGALFNLKNRIKKDFFLFNGDSFFPINLDLFYKFSIKEQKIISIACKKNTNYKSNKKISNLIIKNNILHNNNKKSNIMNGGIYYIKKNFLKLVPNKVSSLEDDYLKDLIVKKKVSGKIFSNYFIDIGIKKNLNFAKKTLLKSFSTKAAFLDRDGVINKDTGYVYKISKFKFLKGVLKGMEILSKKKYLIIVVTNQSGIGRGFYKIRDFKKLTEHMKRIVSKNNSNIDDVYFCPHHPKYGLNKFKKNCKYRKPKPGMLLNAISDWSINTKKSFMIGDSVTDEQASIKSKIKFFYKSEEPFNNQINKIINNIN